MAVVSTVERPRWPWPGDTPCERARRIANALLLQLAPEAQREAIRQARAVGETWLGPELLRWTDDDVITTAEAAELLHVREHTIRQWHSRDGLPNAGQPGRYQVRTLLDFTARRRRERAAQLDLA